MKDLKIKVHHTHGPQNVPASHAEPLLQALLRAKIDIPHSCGGMGTCGTCRVFVRGDAHDLTRPEPIEQELRLERGFAPEERLACQTRILNSTEIRLPSKSMQ